MGGRVEIATTTSHQDSSGRVGIVLFDKTEGIEGERW